MAPAETPRFRKHVSPPAARCHSSSGLKASNLWTPAFLPDTIFRHARETVEALQSGLSGDSYGKGSTAEQGEASASTEAIERYSGIFQGDEIRTIRRFVDFPAGDAIHPNDVLL